MGNMLLTLFSPKAKDPVVEPASPTVATAHQLFLKDQVPEVADWQHESYCRFVQRLFGILPDSETEELKRAQQFPLYDPKAKTRNAQPLLATRLADALVKIQKFYRRYRAMQKWHIATVRMLEIARYAREIRRVLQDEELLLKNFREILMTGFSAQKVSISGVLKPVTLQLVLRPEQAEAYLTWKPSRKSTPKITLHDIEEVIPVEKNTNKTTARLTKKVSYRRGLIIICKSHHRGRIVLELDSTRERDLLVEGFGRLLMELDRFQPSLDDHGAIRRSAPRKQSVVSFFDPSLFENGHLIIEQEVQRRVSRQFSDTALLTNIFSERAVRRHSTALLMADESIEDSEQSDEHEREQDSPHPLTMDGATASAGLPAEEVAASAEAETKADKSNGENGDEEVPSCKLTTVSGPALEQYYVTRFDEKEISGRTPELAVR